MSLYKRRFVLVSLLAVPVAARAQSDEWQTVVAPDLRFRLEMPSPATKTCPACFTDRGSTAIIWNPAGVLAKVTDIASPFPVTLINAGTSSFDFQFQFLSQSGFNHDVLYATNLQTGTWKNFTTIQGDGTLKTVFIPLSFFSNSHQGFVRVTTR